MTRAAPLTRVIWTGTLAAIGGAAFACWAIGGLLVLSPRGAGLLAIAAGFLLVGYLAVILWVSRSFTIAVANYAPAAAFLLIAFGLAYRRRRSKSLLAGLAGVVLSFVAAAIQQAGIDLGEDVDRSGPGAAARGCVTVG